MGNVIRINCRELCKNSIYIKTQIARLKEIIVEMKTINDDIKDSWDGIDYDAFYQKFDKYLDSFDAIEEAILENSEKMIIIAKRHGNIDSSLIDTSNKWGTSHGN